MKFVRGVLLSIAAIVGVVVLAFAVLAGSMLYSGWRNQSRADEFCAGVAPGTPAGELAARAEAADGRYYTNDITSVHSVRFQGWGRADCELTVVDGKVASKRVVAEPYD